MKKKLQFFKSNAFALLFIFLLTFILVIIYYWINSTKKWLNDFSVILAIPSFLMSFIVLNSFSMTSEELERYHKKKKLDEKQKEIIRKEYIEYLSDTPMQEIERAENDLRNYILKKKQNVSINAQLINRCKKNIEKFQEFFDKTEEEIIYGVLPIVENKNVILERGDTSCPSLQLNKKDLENLKKNLELLSKDMFTNNELSDENLCLLENLFNKEKGLFSNFFKINKVYIESENIATDGEGDFDE